MPAKLLSEIESHRDLRCLKAASSRRTPHNPRRFWSAVTCHRSPAMRTTARLTNLLGRGMRAKLLSEITPHRDLRCLKAASSRRTPHSPRRFWSAVTCHRSPAMRTTARLTNLPRRGMRAMLLSEITPHRDLHCLKAASSRRTPNARPDQKRLTPYRERRRYRHHEEKVHWPESGTAD